MTYALSMLLKDHSRSTKQTYRYNFDPRHIKKALEQLSSLKSFKWSRGESNPYPPITKLKPLHACLIVQLSDFRDHHKQRSLNLIDLFSRLKSSRPKSDQRNFTTDFWSLFATLPQSVA